MSGGISAAGIGAGLASAAGAVGTAATAAAPFISAALPVASFGMSILGAGQKSAADTQAGQIAYTNALLRRNAAYATAAEEDVNAGQEVAAGQRQQIQALTRGQLLASRMRAVMGASGAGYDPNLIASLQGEGKYAGDVAAYDAAERARGLTNRAILTRYGGDTGVFTGSEDQTAANARASSDLIGGIGPAALTFAQHYGGPGSTGSGSTGDSVAFAPPAGGTFTTAQGMAMSGLTDFNPIT